MELQFIKFQKMAGTAGTYFIVPSFSTTLRFFHTVPLSLWRRRRGLGLGPLDAPLPRGLGGHLDRVAAVPVEELILVHAVNHPVVGPVQAASLLDLDADQLNFVLLCHVAPAGRVEEGVEPHGDDVPEDLGLDELAVQEAIEALPEKVPLPVCRFIFPLSP